MISASIVYLTVTVSTRRRGGAEVTEPAVRRPKAGVRERGETTITSARGIHPVLVIVSRLAPYRATRGTAGS